MSEDQKKLEIVTGNGKDLDFSPVFEHLSVAKPKKKEEKKIVIPEVKKKDSSKEKKE